MGSLIGGVTDRFEIFRISTANGAWTFVLMPLSGITTARQIGVLKTSSDENAITVDADGTEIIGPASETTDIIAGQGEYHMYRKVSSTVWDIVALVPGLTA